MPMFDIVEISGKGRGLVAVSDIPKGARIIIEKPLFTLPAMAPESLHLAVAAKLKALPKDTQRQFLSLHNNFPGKSALGGIFKTNALPCGPGFSITKGAVYPTICLINHDCAPNAHNNWNPDAGHETIHALRPIAAGEEITIRYDRGGPFATRQAYLKKHFGFQCTCSVCSLEPAARQASDSRRLRVEVLDEAIGDGDRLFNNPGESLRYCYALLRVLEEEFPGDGAQDARVCYDAFQMCIGHGDQARAAVLAERAYRARVVCEGEDSPETQRMKAFSMRPTEHLSFEMCSRKWRRAKNMVPKGLDAAQFEMWLFKLPEQVRYPDVEDDL